MSDPVKYGTVAMSAGLFIVASLWWLRPGPTILGMDQAALLAGRAERQTLGYLTGTNAPAWPADTVTATMAWSQIYGETLCALRTLATNTPAALPAVLWLDASLTAPADGGDLASATVSWKTASTNLLDYTDTNLTARLIRTHTLSAASNALDLADSTASRLPDSGVRTLPWVTPTNAPLSLLLYGVVDGAPQTAGNWWTRSGLGTNVYRLACEFIRDTDTVTLTPLASAGVSLSTNRFSFAYGEHASAQTLTLTAASGAAHDGAAVWLASCPGRSNALVAAADWQDTRVYTSELGGYTRRTVFAPAAGSESVAFSVSHTFDWSGGFLEQDVSIEALGAGVSVSPSSVYLNYTLRAVTATVQPGCGGLIRFTSDVGASYVAVCNTNLPTTLRVSPALNQIAYGSESATLSVSLATPKTEGLVELGKSVTTANLDQARCMLTNLTRTVWIGAWDALEAGGCTNFLGGYSASYTTNTVNAAPALDLDAFIADGIAAVAETSAGAEAWDGLLCSVELDATSDESAATPGTDTYYTDHMGFTAAYASKVLTGCRLPYPSDYACASGHVARLAYYLVAAPYRPARRVQPYANLYAAAHVVSYTGDSVQPSANNAADLGLSFSLCPLADPSWPADSLTEGYELDGYPASPVSAVRLTKIGEWTAPAARPVFGLGRSAPDLSGASLHGCYFRVSDFDPDEDWNWWDLREYKAGVQILYFVAVVDWTWTHFGPVPYVPELHTPEWAVTNTP